MRGELYLKTLCVPFILLGALSTVLVTGVKWQPRHSNVIARRPVHFPGVGNRMKFLLHRDDSSSSSNSTDTSQMSIGDQVGSLISQWGTSIGGVATQVNMSITELSAAVMMVNQSLSQLSSNELGRQSVVIEYNKISNSLNSVLSDMTAGSQSVNSLVALANRISASEQSSITDTNNSIGVLNDWMVNMDSWVQFILQETNQIDVSQGNLVTWGDSVSQAINAHEISTMELAQGMFELESQVITINDAISSIVNVTGYKSSALSITDASGGTGWGYMYWG